MKILITGGTGFIGSYLFRHCLDNGHKVTICDNNLRGKKDAFIDDTLKNTDATFMKLDLTKTSDVEKLDKDYEIVFHLAAINGTENFYKIPYSVMEVAIKSTMLLLEHFENTGCKFIFSSSSEVYAGTIKSFPDLIPTSESVPCTIEDIKNERFSYGGSKLACEILLNSFSVQKKIDYQIIRYHNIYGPRMGTKHVIPQFIHRAKNEDGSFIMYGGEQTRAFCYVDDAVRATLDVAMSPSKNDIYHIGNDSEEIKIIELAKMILSYYNKEHDFEFREPPPGSVARRCPDVTKIKGIVDYEPSISLSNGLIKTIEWYDKWFETNDIGGIL